MDYAYEFDGNADRLVLRDAPDGSIGVWNTGIGTWQARGISVAEIDTLIASGAFAHRLRALRDVLALPEAGPFDDDGAHAADAR